MERVYDHARSRVALSLPGLVLTLPVSACDSSTPFDREAAGGESGVARAGISHDVVMESAVDGAAIAFTAHEPTDFVEGSRYPIVLEGHGIGGSRLKAAARPPRGAVDLIGRLLDRGYGVISTDQRGHGESGGKIRVLDHEFDHFRKVLL